MQPYAAYRCSGYDTTLVYQNQSRLSTELDLAVGEQDGQGKKRDDLYPHTNAGTAVATATCHVLESSE